ncbi:hypothetical protein F5B17DRAFT_390893 [Nemania serpens]|nr:hypothetical protein F5B17DRAFT_390893 [Nemania serpens]
MLEIRCKVLFVSVACCLFACGGLPAARSLPSGQQLLRFRYYNPPRYLNLTVRISGFSPKSTVYYYGIGTYLYSD